MTSVTAQEYIAAGMSATDAAEMVKADQSFEGARNVLQVEGATVKAQLPRNKGQEVDWWRAGFRPYLLRDGRLSLCILGVWAKRAPVQAGTATINRDFADAFEIEAFE